LPIPNLRNYRDVIGEAIMNQQNNLYGINFSKFTYFYTLPWLFEF